MLKSAIQLKINDVLVDGNGNRHTVIRWDTYPDIAVVFETDTGHTITNSWVYDAKVPAYEVVTGDAARD